MPRNMRCGACGRRTARVVSKMFLQRQLVTLMLDLLLCPECYHALTATLSAQAVKRELYSQRTLPGVPP